MIRLLSYLPSLRRDQDGGSNGEEPENSSPDGKSSSSDGEYRDCDSAEEFFSDDEEEAENEEKSAIENSVCATPSSIATEPFTASSDATDGRFEALDPTDDFDQRIAPLKDAASSSKKISSPSRKGFEQTRNFPASEPFSPKTSEISHGHGSSDAHVLPRLAQVVVGGSTVYKNKLQTLCQRGRIPIPSYTHVKEGPAHAPNFTASVWVCGEKYDSFGNYSSKGEAEQAAAKNALTILCPDQSFDGATNVAGKEAKTGGQIKNDTFEKGLTIHSVIDFTVEEKFVASSFPLSKKKNSARLESASKAHEQFWGPFHKESIALRGFSTPSQPILSDNGAAPDNNNYDHAQGIAVQFSGQKPNKTIPVTKSATQARERKWPNATKHLEALGKLDFSTKAFPLLTRLDGLPLEEAYSVDEIEGLQYKSPDEVHPYLSGVDARHDRANSSFPPPTVPELRLYDCYISTNPKGEHKFKVSDNRQGSTLLQRTLGFDKILRVFFDGTTLLGHYKGILTNGIFVGPRLYQYFVHKVSDDMETDEGKRNEKRGKTEEEKTKGLKCYFVCTDSMGESDLNSGLRTFRTIAEARYLFAHVHTCPTVCKYIARLQLCLSKTITIERVSFSDLRLKEKEDLPSRDKKSLGAFFTDGTGLISSDLARKMPRASNGKVAESQQNDFCEGYPSLIQVRFFHEGAAHKGTLLAHTGLEANTIEYYSSMKKVQRDPLISGSISSLELVSTSRRPSRPHARLSQDLIVLLSIGGVEGSVFLDAVKAQIAEMRKMLGDRQRALEVANQSGWKSDLVETTIQMLAAGIPMEEPGLQTNLLHLIRFNLDDYAKGRVPLDDTYYLMGTADPTGTLRPNEVVIFRDGRFVVGEKLLHKHPGKHPGDPHKVLAVYSKAIESVVGGDKNMILFSTQGSRPLSDEMAGSDLDGDEYWICENKKVVEQFKEFSTRWTKGHVEFEDGKGLTAPSTLSADGLEDALAEEYLNERFEKIAVIGIASFRWLVHADAFLNPETSPKEREIHMNELLKYPDFIYEAVDFKSGKQVLLFREHDLYRRYKAPYLPKRPVPDAKGGKSILGQIYDTARAASRELKKDPSCCRDDYQAHPRFYVQGSEKHIQSWEAKIKKYGKEMLETRDKESGEWDTDAANEVNRNYKMLLFGAPSFEETTRDPQTVLEEASAIYQIIYRRAREDIVRGEKPKLAFAWNVAGLALARIYLQKQTGDPVTWSRAAYNEVFRKSTRR